MAKAISSSESSSMREKVFGTSSEIISSVIEKANTASLKFSNLEGLSFLILNLFCMAGIFWGKDNAFC